MKPVDSASNQRGETRAPAWPFAGAILLGAFLLFQVQPITGKYILPWFGGVPAVWTTCLLFFQAMLFAGYLYAHLLQQISKPRWQAVVHLALIALALTLIPIGPSDYWKPTDSNWPIPRILALLVSTVGLPYLALAGTSPLLQAWFSRAFPGRSPYRLYALSNFGSLAALLSYPFLFEPTLRLDVQAWLWSATFIAYGAACIFCTRLIWNVPPVAAEAADDAPPDETESTPSRSRRAALRRQQREAAAAARRAARNVLPATGLRAEVTLFSATSSPASWARFAQSPITRAILLRAGWLLLPAFASLMLMATTNHICQDVAVVPLLWILPLSLYLLSFIICFDRPGWYARRLWAIATLCVTVAVGIQALKIGAYTEFGQRMALFYSDFRSYLALVLASLFALCMICHGELYRLRPSASRLTEYYLWIAAGGAVGGVMVSVVAPLVFHGPYEWGVGMVATLVMTAAILTACARRIVVRAAIVGATIFVFAVGASWTLEYISGRKDIVDRNRNFYGSLLISREDAEDGADTMFTMQNGLIKHGTQHRAESLRRWPTTYYVPKSGLGRVLNFFGAQSKPIRVAAVGLGAGTLAAYGRPGDFYRFYEINPLVIDFCHRWYSYLQDSLAKTEIKLGDARLSMEAEAAEPSPQPYNVIVLDAFTSDSIPVHLLTDEAFGIYTKLLAPDGAIAVHVSNQHLDLAPVVYRLAARHGLTCADVWYSPSEAELFELQAKDKATLRPNEIAHYDVGELNHWIILTRNQALLDQLKAGGATIVDKPGDGPLWTDQFSNLFQIFKF